MIPASVRIFVCADPIDMRMGFDRLAQAARERTHHDPLQGGALFVFANRQATRLKLLWFEQHGMCILYKRLHRAVFDLPAQMTGIASVHIDSAALAKLLAGVPRVAKDRARSGAKKSDSAS